MCGVRISMYFDHMLIAERHNMFDWLWIKTKLSLVRNRSVVTFLDNRLKLSSYADHGLCLTGSNKLSRFAVGFAFAWAPRTVYFTHHAHHD